MKGRREVIGLLSGLGLGAVTAELFEKLYDIPSIEGRFRSEIEYWAGMYNDAVRELESYGAG